MPQVRKCIACDYQRGFHVSFSEAEEGGHKVILICPSCGQSYSIGWMHTDEIHKPVRGQKFI